MIDRDLLKSFKFFKANGGYIEGRRAECALQLARAEREASAEGLRFCWQDDSIDDPHYRDFDDDTRPNTYEIVFVYGPDSEDVLASLGAVIDATEDYRRVVEAELAIEALDELAARLASVVLSI